MTDDAKQQYFKMVEADKERFNNETEQLNRLGYFVNKDGVKSNETKIDINKLPMDTVKPKKPINSLFIYIRDHVDEYRAKVEKFVLTESTKAMSAQFGALSEKEKSKYTKIAQADKARYQKELDQL